MGTSRETSEKVEKAVQMVIKSVKATKKKNQGRQKPDRFGSYIKRGEVNYIIHEASQKYGIDVLYLNKILGNEAHKIY